MYVYMYMYVYIYIYIYITQQRDIYDTVIFRFLQIHSVSPQKICKNRNITVSQMSRC